MTSCASTLPNLVWRGSFTCLGVPGNSTENRPSGEVNSFHSSARATPARTKRDAREAKAMRRTLMSLPFTGVGRAGAPTDSKVANPAKQLPGVDALDVPGDDGLPAVAGKHDRQLAVGAAPASLGDLADAEDAVAHERAARKHWVVVAFVLDVVD